MSIDFPKEEELTIERWREINAFHRQVLFVPLLACLPFLLPILTIGNFS